VTCQETDELLSEDASVQGEIRVESVSDYQAFLELEPIWNEVAQAAGLDHPFLEHAWVRTWWECFGAGSILQILVLKAGDRPIAIAPLILTPIRMWGIKVRRLGFFYNAHVPRADFIIARRSQEVHGAIWRHLSLNRTWDVLQFCQLPEGSRTLEGITRLAAADNCRTGAWLSGASPHQPICTSWGQYFNGLTAKHRANLRNRFKRLNGVGPVEMQAITSDENLAEALEAGMELEAAACLQVLIRLFEKTVAVEQAD
jgi:CelD/BcsL family acetyltransferase involved in cellulose biosynthesis